MARQRTPLQVNQFVGGLNTEANPLSYPPNNSLDEQNMEANRDGSRQRRPGFDVEEYYNENIVPIVVDDTKIVGRGQYTWLNAGGNADAELMVIQVGNYIAVHKLGTFPLSSSPIYSKVFDASVYGVNFGFAVVDGSLVVATGEKEVLILEYNGVSVTETSDSLLIRDLFGVDAIVSSVELTAAQNQQVRPASLNNNHIYNLRNQTFALPRVDDANVTTLRDPINEFYAGSGNSVYPSNADSVIPFLNADSSATSDRLVERYYGGTSFRTPPSTSPAPSGYFIIDALERGVSRLERVTDLQDTYSQLTQTVPSLPADTTPGGPSVLAQYSGRVWYAGFSGDVTDGDSRSPRMSSYILYSRVVTDPSEITLCYQEADPTSNVDPDRVDTDGGFIKVDGAYNILALIPIESSLFVLAENGVWRISGLDDNMFTATSFTVSKLSTEGCFSGASAVVNKNRLTFWGESAIYGIERNQVGYWELVNITESTIQSLYDDISLSDKQSAIGYFDNDNNTIRWVYGATLTDKAESNELILDFRFSSFMKNKITSGSGVKGLFTVAGGETIQSASDLIVTVEGVDAVVGLEPVTVTRTILQRDITRAYYGVILQFGDVVSYSFGRYNRVDTTDDWTRLGDATDTPAFLQPGPITGGDARLRKDVPYITVYFEQEDEAGTNYIEPSCVLQARWDWTPILETGKWTSSREVYRRQRASNDGGVLVTRNKVRGNGRSVSFRFESSPSKSLHIYGWEFNLEATKEE